MSKYYKISFKKMFKKKYKKYNIYILYIKIIFQKLEDKYKENTKNITKYIFFKYRKILKYIKNISKYILKK